MQQSSKAALDLACIVLTMHGVTLRVGPEHSHQSATLRGVQPSKDFKGVGYATKDGDLDHTWPGAQRAPGRFVRALGPIGAYTGASQASGRAARSEARGASDGETG